jgi:hypothetical protein
MFFSDVADRPLLDEHEQRACWDTPENQQRGTATIVSESEATTEQDAKTESTDRSSTILWPDLVCYLLAFLTIYSM